MPKKVVVIGPESTGKSTLSESLAMHFGCDWVPEYAREYLENLGRQYRYEDLLTIAKGQTNLEDQMASNNEGLLICDTDLQVIKIWSQHRFGKVDPWIEYQIKSRKYDLYLLANIDIPWQDDPLREHPAPEMRQYFFRKYHETLEASRVPFYVVSGDKSARLQTAIAQVKALLGIE
jgi:NadR type nicotinamide-nucleotide adenylyltransferase